MEQQAQYFGFSELRLVQLVVSAPGLWQSDPSLLDAALCIYSHFSSLCSLSHPHSEVSQADLSIATPLFKLPM